MAKDYAETKHLLVNQVIIPSTLRGPVNAFHLNASRSCAKVKMPVSAIAPKQLRNPGRPTLVKRVARARNIAQLNKSASMLDF
jgi:hypothetical protein